VLVPWDPLPVAALTSALVLVKEAGVRRCEQGVEAGYGAPQVAADCEPACAR